MAERHALLVIADIGGYTRFMRLHRMSLAHAQENTARLLGAVIDAAPELQLVALEGDGAFLCAADGAALRLGELGVAMHRAFHAEQQRMYSVNLCVCDGCAQTGQLTVKFVAHVGEVVEQRLKHGTTLAGLDVILVHRMLKNSVPVPKYILMTEAVLSELVPAFRERAEAIEEELEGLGRQQLWFVDVSAIASDLPPAAPAPWSERIGYAARLTARTLPRMLGVTRPLGRRQEARPL